ncbi:MAG TPA: hypothetical protein VFL97_07070 [Nitrococcus sp.]|nr:hypothetical protein [Nitrococcus sp.]
MPARRHDPALIVMSSTTTPVPILWRTEAGTMGVIVVSFVWLGMIISVSFLATLAKLLAPGFSLPTVLDGGHHTFLVFAGMEIVCCHILAGFVLFRAPGRWAHFLAAVPCAIVALEVSWLLPALDTRASLITAGGIAQVFNLCLLYLVLEAIKLAALLVLGIGSLHHLVRVGHMQHLVEAHNLFNRNEATRTLPNKAPDKARVLYLDRRRPRPGQRRIPR